MGDNTWVAIYLTILMIVLVGIGYVFDGINKAKGKNGSNTAVSAPEEKPSDEA